MLKIVNLKWGEMITLFEAGLLCDSANPVEMFVIGIGL